MSERSCLNPTQIGGKEEIYPLSFPIPLKPISKPFPMSFLPLSFRGGSSNQMLLLCVQSPLRVWGKLLLKFGTLWMPQISSLCVCLLDYFLIKFTTFNTLNQNFSSIYIVGLCESSSNMQYLKAVAMKRIWEACVTEVTQLKQHFSHIWCTFVNQLTCSNRWREFKIYTCPYVDLHNCFLGK